MTYTRKPCVHLPARFYLCIHLDFFNSETGKTVVKKGLNPHLSNRSCHPVFKFSITSLNASERDFRNIITAILFDNFFDL